MVAHWSALDEPQRKEYKRVEPGTMKDITWTTQVENQDLTKYEPQVLEDTIPEHFTMFMLSPYEIDVLTVPAPQVIADARNPTFES